VLGYCLLPNRIHIVALPAGEDGLRATFSTLHKEYARTVNRRMGWKGHLWQERFGSVPLDEEWAEVALRYVDLAPVRAGLAEKPEAYPFSSARGHLGRVRDGLLVQDLFLRYASTPWEQALAGPLEQEHLEKLEQHLRTLWPLGSEAFLDWIQAETGIAPRPRKPGPKPRSEREEEERGEPPAEDDFA
jgi:putative transposase